MALSTLKTVLGYFRSLLGKYTPLQFRAGSLDDIYNYLPISERLGTSGQPTEQQFELVKAAGFHNVINLAPHNAENSLDDEAELLGNLGFNYIHIPVDFGNPTNADFYAFCERMKELQQSKVWVHCAANMRVSAFVYRYRCEVLGEGGDRARQSLAQIWEPFGVWKEFVAPLALRRDREDTQHG